MPRKLVARDHREAYHLWAAHFSDPALMANRDVETTRQKIARLAQQLPLKPSSCVLDVGPGIPMKWSEVQIRRAGPADAEVLTRIAHAAKRYWGYTDDLIDLWKVDLTVTPESIEADLVYCGADGSQILALEPHHGAPET